MSAQLSRDDWKGRVGGLSYRNQAFIDGKFVDSLTGKTFDCVNPATGQVLTKVAACEQEDVDAAVKAARAAFEKGTGRNMAPAHRKRIMLKLAELMMKNRDELALLETLDMGKPIGTRPASTSRARPTPCSGTARRSTRSTTRSPRRPGNVVAMITREPVGVVAAVVPWNFPLLMACWKICAGAGGRQLGDPQARRAVAAHRHPHRRTGGRSRHPRGRVQRGAGLRRDRGPGARPAHGRRRAGLHRLDRGRQVLPEVFRREQHEAGLARMRRQVAEHRAGRRARSRCRGPAHRLRHLVQPGRGLQRRLAPDRRGHDQGRSSSRR